MLRWGPCSHLHLRVDHVEVKLIWVLLQSFLSQSCEGVLFLVVVTIITEMM